MAAADVATLSPIDIPGLGKPLSEVAMGLSRITYNSLPGIEAQVQLHREHTEHIKALLAIIDRHSMSHFFGIHSAHRHGMLPNDTVRLEEDMGINGLTWNRATDIHNLNTRDIHTTFFKVNEAGLAPFEFAAGPSPVAGEEIPSEFLSEFATYVKDKGLTGLVSLEVGNFAAGQVKTAELEIQWGDKELLTVTVPVPALINAGMELVPTGWNLSPRDAGTHWAKLTKPVNTHRVFFDSTESVTPELLFVKLMEMGLILKV
ncbi:hypothetical protein PC9H_001942 [Pleurotus ostreatus]|uniref:Uncharacterized protein n=1 Tax=Pleurotus ostreatus TaxID=5322 RepID=A0A8H6ZPF1_PLEOS|nr:uncharacterized protein PC9H_001942 [Pleurotus ostreatus]KAF7419355.1 hypothetical protein PC9H_001942 [Pleurotus ostreatus]KAJ8689858.1 hypothetical protein PTI98_012718 [Pleurotus ostreatus]